MSPTRPLLRYHGGKWRVADNIIDRMPAHQTYVEPYGGAAGVLLQKPRSKNEFYNDLDSEVVNVFRILRDPEKAKQLKTLLELTPFSRDEFYNAYIISDDHVEQARRTIIRSHMGFGSSGITKPSSGFRSSARNESGNSTDASQWANLPQHIGSFVERFRGVVVENKPALDLFARLDHEDTLFFVDPPYMASTRSSMRSAGQKYYRHEMTDSEHEELLKTLVSLKGRVMLSGYDSDLYRDYLADDWELITFKARAQGGKGGGLVREECLWINPSAEQHNLFTVA